MNCFNIHLHKYFMSFYFTCIKAGFRACFFIFFGSTFNVDATKQFKRNSKAFIL